MKTLRAVHTIHVTIAPGKPGNVDKGIAPVRPKVREIAPGTLFKAMSKEQEEDLLARSAAVLANEAGGKVETLVDPDALKGVVAPGSTQAKTDEVDLNGMTKAALLAFAAEQEPPIDVDKSDKVAELRDAIAAELEARAEAGGAGEGEGEGEGDGSGLI